MQPPKQTLAATNPERTTDDIRFAFGKNWRSFLGLLNEERLREARNSLATMLECDTLAGTRFVDVGCGSGLFSLAAIRLGASEVLSFDHDPDSVACAQFLNERFGPFPNWHIAQGSVLDTEWLRALGKFDVVYSWGVLHHTGAMWTALDNVVELVADGGYLFISIYNDQGPRTSFWKQVKRFYNVSPRPVRWLMGNAYFLVSALWLFLMDLLHRRPVLNRYRGRGSRGMGLYHDAIDWIGGYPFEAAKPEAVFDYYRRRGFVLCKLVTRQGLGCNEFLFRRRNA